MLRDRVEYGLEEWKSVSVVGSEDSSVKPQDQVGLVVVLKARRCV